MEQRESMTNAQLNFIRCSVKSELLMIKKLLGNMSLITQAQYAPPPPPSLTCHDNNTYSSSKHIADQHQKVISPITD